MMDDEPEYDYDALRLIMIDMRGGYVSREEANDLMKLFIALLSVPPKEGELDSNQQG